MSKKDDVVEFEPDREVWLFGDSTYQEMQFNADGSVTIKTITTAHTLQ